MCIVVEIIIRSRNTAQKKNKNLCIGQKNVFEIDFSPREIHYLRFSRVFNNTVKLPTEKNV